jgi:hypothetical protein
MKSIIHWVQAVGLVNGLAVVYDKCEHLNEVVQHPENN